MSATAQISYDLDVLPKTALAKMAGKLGLKADWARETKANIISQIEAFSEDDILQALRDIGATDEDIENMRMEVQAVVSAKEAISAMMEGEQDRQPTPVPTQQRAAMPVPASERAKLATTTPKKTDTKLSSPPPNLDQAVQIAAALVPLLQSSGSGIDSETVTEIASEVAHSVTQRVLDEKIAALDEKWRDQMSTSLANAVEIARASLANEPGRKLDVTSKNGTHSIEGRQHRQFELLLKILGSSDSAGNSNLNVWLTGMPGTGKTRAAANAAQALGMAFYCNGSVANKYELIGFKDAHGNYQSTPFRDAWENGGVYLFDEIDGSVPAAVLAFNSALANGIVAFPDGMMKRHKDCIIIAAANTNGQGATAELVGRMKQDAAFLDRFVMMNWDIDEELERHITQNDEWLEYVHRVRRKALANGLKVMITPRASLYGAQLLASGIDRHTVVAMTLKKGMSDAQWQMIA